MAKEEHKATNSSRSSKDLDGSAYLVLALVHLASPCRKVKRLTIRIHPVSWLVATSKFFEDDFDLTTIVGKTHLKSHCVVESYSLCLVLCKSYHEFQIVSTSSLPHDKRKTAQVM